MGSCFTLGEAIVDKAFSTTKKKELKVLTEQRVVASDECVGPLHGQRWKGRQGFDSGVPWDQVWELGIHPAS